MSLKSLIASDVSDVFFDTDDFADTGKYSSHDGTIVSAAVTVLFEAGGDLVQTEFGAAMQERVHVKKSDVPRPAAYDELTVDGTVYIVRNRFGGGGGVWVLIVEADPRQIPRNVR
jgi:hypothetical protein